MNKKTNTLLFILGATAFNIVVTAACFLIALAIYGKFLYSMLPERSAAWALPVIFVISIAASFFIYRALIKLLMKKVNMNKYFVPIFKPSQPSRNPE